MISGNKIHVTALGAGLLILQQVVQDMQMHSLYGAGYHLLEVA
jgi:hypothetical protein